MSLGSDALGVSMKLCSKNDEVVSIQVVTFYEGIETNWTAMRLVTGGCQGGMDRFPEDMQEEVIVKC